MPSLPGKSWLAHRPWEAQAPRLLELSDLSLFPCLGPTLVAQAPTTLPLLPGLCVAAPCSASPRPSPLPILPHGASCPVPAPQALSFLLPLLTPDMPHIWLAHVLAATTPVPAPQGHVALFTADLALGSTWHMIGTDWPRRGHLHSRGKAQSHVSRV